MKIKGWGVLFKGKPAHYMSGEELEEITVYKTKKALLRDVGKCSDYDYVKIEIIYGRRKRTRKAEGA